MTFKVKFLDLILIPRSLKFNKNSMQTSTAENSGTENGHRPA